MKKWAITTAVLLVMGAAGAAYAAIPSASGVIHACYKPFAFRLIDGDSQACTSKEKAISWSVQGPQGPAGPQGPQGPPGPPGAAGSAEVFSAEEAGPQVSLLGGGEVVRKSVPPGRYVVFAEGEVSAEGSPANGACFLSLDGVAVESSGFDVPFRSTTSVALLETIEIEEPNDQLAPNPILSVNCRSFAPAHGTGFEIAAMSVGAIR